MSPVFDSERSRSACLRLGIYMLGVDSGSLTIEQFPERDKTETKILGTMKGNFGGEWKTFVVDVEQMKEAFQISLTAEIGTSYLGDIAVDNIELLDEEHCSTIRQSYVEPQPIKGQENLSPSSCKNRCSQNVTILASTQGWREGSCKCQSQCLAEKSELCCKDYLNHCSSGQVCRA